MQNNSFSISWGDSSLEMLPSKALLLPHTNELLICDIHLGKSEYFQQHGIPLTKTEELHKVLAQIEALMSREEIQKVSKKNK